MLSKEMVLKTSYNVVSVKEGAHYLNGMFIRRIYSNLIYIVLHFIKYSICLIFYFYYAVDIIIIIITKSSSC